MVRNAPQLFSKEFSRKFFRARMEAAEVDTLVALAREGDHDALEILRKHAGGASRARMNVPRFLHEFVWNILSMGRPKRKADPAQRIRS
ncbi:hypothetical protein [Bradyrhizobium sp. URHC0002]